MIGLPPYIIKRRRGFTLLEVLITAVLSAVLLVSLWSLFGLYSRLLTQGQVTATRAQLIRSVSQQLTDDFRNALQDVSDPRIGLVASAKRFRLMGSAHAVQLDLMRAPTPEEQRRTAYVVVTDNGDQGLGSQALELRTIRYLFNPPQLDDSGQIGPQSGLVRQELDFQPQPESPTADAAAINPTPPASDASGGTDSDTWTPGNAFGSDSGGAADSPPPDLAQLTLPDAGDSDNQSWIPEVINAEFRYFDGFSWTSNWDSLQQGSLPVAVEITLQILMPEETSQLQAAGTTIVGGYSSSSPADSLPTDPASNPLPGKSCRVVVDLPGAVLHQATRTTDSGEAEMMAALDEMMADAAVADQSPPSNPLNVDEFGNPLPDMMPPPSSDMSPSILRFGKQNGNLNNPTPRAAPDTPMRGLQ